MAVWGYGISLQAFNLMYLVESNTIWNLCKCYVIKLCKGYAEALCFFYAKAIFWHIKDYVFARHLEPMKKLCSFLSVCMCKVEIT